jgi:STE24 endopeptidase
VAGYFVVLSVGYGLLLLPVGYYGSFVLPHRYGLSNETRRGWLVDQAKAGVMGLAFGLVVVEVIYYLLRATPHLWWPVAGAFLVLLTVVLANLAPVLLVPLFYKVEPLTDEDLVGRLEKLAARARTSVRGVFTIDLSSKTSAANAMLMGLGNTRRIVLGDTLYADYGPEEIEAILAHELGHHVAHDMWWGMLLQSALTFAGLFLTHLTLSWATRAQILSGLDDVAGMPLMGLVVGGFLAATTPLANTFSRWREGLADEYALRAAGNPRAFVSAMVRLANQNLAEVDPERWVEVLLYSHPAIGKRIARGALELARTQYGRP